MKTFRADLLGLYVAEDETKTMKVERAADDAEYPFRVSVWRGLGEAVHVSARPARWTPPNLEKSQKLASHRCGMLEAELGDRGLGCTYRLYFTAPGPEPKTFDWCAVLSTTTPAEVRVFPESRGSFYDAVLGHYDDFAEELRDAETHWVGPLSTYRVASDAQRSTFLVNTHR